MTTEFEFYWTVASGGSHKALREAFSTDVDVDGKPIPNPDRCMVSYATQNNRPWSGPSWFIDSGGYSMMHGMGEYDTTPREYVEYVAAIETGRDGAVQSNPGVDTDAVDVERYALRDWPCEPDILRKYGRTVEEHQQRTVRDHIRTLEAADDVGVNADPVAVLQGWDVRDYLRHIDMYRDHGLVTDRVGVGSVCRRNVTSQLRAIIQQIRDALPPRVSIHGFGIKRQVLEDGETVAVLGSADSGAWDHALMTAHRGYERRPPRRNCRDWWPVVNTDGLPRAVTKNYHVAYVDYAERLDDILGGVGDSCATRTTSIGDYCDPDADTTQSYQIVECVCGTQFDPGDPTLDVTDAGCRHCRHSIDNINWLRFERSNGLSIVHGDNT